MASTTPTWQLPYPAETDPADVPVDVKALADRLEVVLTQLKSGGAIPGEIRMWPGAAVPVQATFGHWVWADGGVYDTATYPLASGNIAGGWKTHNGKPDPGAGKFRVPDLRGSVPTGMDAMPGGARANRITRAAAAVLAGVTGEELHTLLLAELAAHGHAVNDPQHAHNERGDMLYGGTGSRGYPVPGSSAGPDHDIGQTSTAGAATGITIQNAGGGGAHENLPPATFVPYIVKLDD